MNLAEGFVLWEALEGGQGCDSALAAGAGAHAAPWNQALRFPRSLPSHTSLGGTAALPAGVTACGVPAAGGDGATLPPLPAPARQRRRQRSEREVKGNGVV